MCHAWITHWAVNRAPLTMPRRRSTRDARTHGRNAHEPFFWRIREPIWRLERPFSNCDARNERVDRRTEHGEHPTYQIKHF